MREGGREGGSERVRDHWEIWEMVEIKFDGEGRVINVRLIR